MVNLMLSRKLGELRVTQAELAKKTGIRPNTITDMYHNMAERVNLVYLDRICEALNCELDEILVRTPNEKITIEPCERRTVYKHSPKS